jgi:hypothetical protein
MRTKNPPKMPQKETYALLEEPYELRRVATMEHMNKRHNGEEIQNFLRNKPKCTGKRG